MVVQDYLLIIGAIGLAVGGFVTPIIAAYITVTKLRLEAQSIQSEAAERERLASVERTEVKLAAAAAVESARMIGLEAKMAVVEAKTIAVDVKSIATVVNGERTRMLARITELESAASNHL